MRRSTVSTGCDVPRPPATSAGSGRGHRGTVVGESRHGKRLTATGGTAGPPCRPSASWRTAWRFGTAGATWGRTSATPTTRPGPRRTPTEGSRSNGGSHFSDASTGGRPPVVGIADHAAPTSRRRNKLQGHHIGWHVVLLHHGTGASPRIETHHPGPIAFSHWSELPGQEVGESEIVRRNDDLS